MALPLGAAALFALSDLLERFRAAMDADARLAIYPNGEQLLLIHLAEPKRMGEIAQDLHCLPSNVTALVDQLEAKGLLRREPCPEDRRAKRLILTRRGQLERNKLIHASSEIFVDITGLEEKELELLLSLLARKPANPAAAGQAGFL